ncbi:hypothetical protein KCV07_g10, partial [Aureobasidium melanogenum]
LLCQNRCRLVLVPELTVLPAFGEQIHRKRFRTVEFIFGFCFQVFELLLPFVSLGVKLLEKSKSGGIQLTIRQSSVYNLSKILSLMEDLRTVILVEIVNVLKQPRFILGTTPSKDDR